MNNKIDVENSKKYLESILRQATAGILKDVLSSVDAGKMETIELHLTIHRFPNDTGKGDAIEINVNPVVTPFTSGEKESK